MDRLDICNEIYDTLIDFMPTQQAIDTTDKLMKSIDKYVEVRIKDANLPPELRKFI